MNTERFLHHVTSRTGTSALQQPNGLELQQGEPRSVRGCRRRGLTWSAEIAVALILFSSGLCPAQGPPNEFVFHAYVDPIFGDDEMAFAFNPGNPNDPGLNTPLPNNGSGSPIRARPLDRRVDFSPAVDATTIAGYLQHAPFAFRTLSREKGAIEYVQRLFSTAASGQSPATTVLPWAHPSGRIVTHVVIHCLPGLYGPRNPSLPAETQEIDPTTGLPWNGEVLPIRLGYRHESTACPVFDRISIQGTSALDTIFDGRGNDPNMPVFFRTNFVFHVLPAPALRNHGHRGGRVWASHYRRVYPLDQDVPGLSPDDGIDHERPGVLRQRPGIRGTRRLCQAMVQLAHGWVAMVRQCPGRQGSSRVSAKRSYHGCAAIDILHMWVPAGCLGDRPQDHVDRHGSIHAQLGVRLLTASTAGSAS